MVRPAGRAVGSAQLTAWACVWPEGGWHPCVVLPLVQCQLLQSPYCLSFRHGPPGSVPILSALVGSFVLDNGCAVASFIVLVSESRVYVISFAFMSCSFEITQRVSCDWDLGASRPLRKCVSYQDLVCLCVFSGSIVRAQASWLEAGSFKQKCCPETQSTDFWTHV